MAPRWSHSYRASKVATLTVTSFALATAVLASDGVFALVLGAWSALGATLGPLLVLRVFGRTVPTSWALMMMASGLITVLLWERSAWSDDVFKLLPGLLVPTAVYATLTAAQRLFRPSRERPDPARSA